MARTRSTLNVVSAALALFIMAFLVWDASSAAFTAETQGDTTVSALTITLDGGASLDLTGTALAPGQSVSQCVLVDFDSGGAPVSVTAVDVTIDDTTTLVTPADANTSFHNDLSVDVLMAADCSAGSPTGAAVLGGLLADGSAATAWTPSHGESRGFWVTASLDAGASNAAMGGQAAFSIIWDTQTTP